MKRNHLDQSSSPSSPSSKGVSYSHVLKYTSLLGGVQGFYILMGIIRNKITAILLGVAGIGLIDLYSRTIEMISNTTNFGISFSAVPRISQLYDDKDEINLQHQIRLVRTLTVLTALLGTAIGFLAAPWLSTWLQHSSDNTWAFRVLAFAIGCTALTSSETAILKGTRQLKKIAMVSALGALATLFITFPIYWIWGIQGVAPAILLTGISIFFLNLRYTTKFYPYRLIRINNRLLKQAAPIFRLGIAYISAGFLGSGAELLIRSVMVNSDRGLEAVGLYATGLTLVVSYARLIFVTMDTDYFPRLSVAIQDPQQLNATANQQINVLVLLMTPFLIVFSLALPLILHILYTEKFLPVIPMVLCALPYMFFKAIYSPIAYLPLANGDSRLYFIMELVYDIQFAILVICGFHFFGIVGAGCGLALANLFDLILLPLVYKKIYGFKFQNSTIVHCAFQGLLLVIGLVIACHTDILIKGIAGAVLCMGSLTVTFQMIKKEIQLPHKFQIILDKFKRH